MGKTKAAPKKRRLTQEEQDQQKREQFVKRRNTHKYIRGFIQYAALAAFIYWLCTSVLFPKPYVAYQNLPQERQEQMSATVSGDYSSSPNEFIAVAYSGVATMDSPESTIVSQRRFKEQMQALVNSGYVTISQKDIEDYYLYGGTLPEKSLFLLFEDGISDTTALVEDTLREHNYLATVITYANNLDDVGHNYLNVPDLQKLLNSTYWEMGVNGYRLHYINVFDRYENYYGELNSDEYALVHTYLKRDYNHYLMDFIRDEDRLRMESVEAMKERIRYDYEQMQLLYTENFGYLPGCYVLMHSNTGMFGTDPLVSAENRNYITTLFAMNFNRQGSALNNLESSIYDLSRIQPQSYWYTNHLLMRIKDDTGHDVAFVVTDDNEMEKWYLDRGAVEFRDNNKIVLTCEGYGFGTMALKNMLLTDVDLSVSMEGNLVGKQSIYLRTDRTHADGIGVTMEDNMLYVRESSNSEETELFSLNLFDFDGGPEKSVAEDELEGLVELQNAIIRFDNDADRINDASGRLGRLTTRDVTTLEEGGEGYVPVNDLRDPGKRQLRILLQGEYMTIYVDGRVAVENLKVSSTKRGTVVLESSPLVGERYSQRNLADDVYDAVFTDLTIADPAKPEEILYTYRIDGLEKVGVTITDFYQTLTNFFLRNF